MSCEFRVRVPPTLPGTLVASPEAGRVWSPLEVSDPLTAGRWNVFLDRISTRLTAVEYEPPELTVTMRAGTSPEDCDLALEIVREAAALGSGQVDASELGAVALGQIDTIFDDTWKRRQLESAARISVRLAQERGMIALPGPTRDVWIGPQMVAELDAAGDTDAADRLVAVMRRALWPDPRYESAGVYSSTGSAGDSFTLAILVPDRPCVLSHTDRLALEDDVGIVMIPRSALDSLPVETTPLDDRNQLVESIPSDVWPEVCQIARSFDVRQ